jgi:hypothetical protein
LIDLSPEVGYEGCAGGAEVLQAPGQDRPSVLQAPARGRQQLDTKEKLREAAETKAKVVID